MKLVVASSPKSHQFSASSLARSRPVSRIATVTRAGKDGEKDVDLADRLLDYVQAGPKLRRWYGQDSLPRDGLMGAADQEKKGDQEAEEEMENVERDHILVTDAEGPTGEQILLQLILLRANVKALVRDIGAARAAFGPYVTPVVAGAAVSKKALANVDTVIIAGKADEKLLQACKKFGVPRVILVVSEKSAGGLFGALSGVGEDDEVVSDRTRVQTVKASGVPSATIVSVAQLRDVPGGRNTLSLSPGAPSSSAASKEIISREDVATVVARLAVKGASEPAAAAAAGVQELALKVGAAGSPQWDEILA